MTTIELVLSKARRALIPPPRLRLSDWIEANIALPQCVCAQPGHVRLWPFQREIADTIGDPLIERVPLVKPVRVGVTTLLTSAFASFVANESAPILCLLPAEADCRDYVVSDIEPIFAASKAVADALADDRQEAERNTLLSRRFGTLPIKALESPKVNAVFIDYHEEIAIDRPREADNRMTVLCAVFNEAKRRGLITRNPLDGFERAYSSDRSEMIWTEADISKFMAHAPLELQQALILAIHSGQRYGNLIRLRWSDYDGEVVRLVQSKTKAKVPVPVSAALKRMLADMPRQGPFILTRADGRPWHTERNDKELGTAWRRHMQVAGFYPKPFEELTREEKQSFLHFHDLRGTAVTLLAEAGCTIRQVSAITGHTLNSATRILRKYLASTEAIARAAILRFENAPETAFANRLQTTAQRAIMPITKC